MLYRLNPVTPAPPKAANSQPPTTAPTIPSTMSRTTPSPVLLTILLATKPAISPSTIQPMIDIPLSPSACRRGTGPDRLGPVEAPDGPAQRLRRQPALRDRPGRVVGRVVQQARPPLAAAVLVTPAGARPRARAPPPAPGAAARRRGLAPVKRRDLACHGAPSRGPALRRSAHFLMCALSV